MIEEKKDNSLIVNMQDGAGYEYGLEDQFKSLNVQEDSSTSGQNSYAAQTYNDDQDQTNEDSEGDPVKLFVGQVSDRGAGEVVERSETGSRGGTSHDV